MILVGALIHHENIDDLVHHENIYDTSRCFVNLY